MRSPACFAAVALAITPLPASANPFTPTADINAAVAEFLGAGPGAPGGATRPVDPRLKLVACDDHLAVAWYGRGETSLQVSCPARGWRIFVPVGSTRNTSDQNGRSGDPIVKRGETVSVVYEGRNFMLSRQGEALETGALDQWIRIKPTGDKAQPIRAQVLRPGYVRVSAD